MSDELATAAAAFQSSMSGNAPSSSTARGGVAETLGGAPEYIGADDYGEDAQGYADESDEVRIEPSKQKPVKAERREKEEADAGSDEGDDFEDNPYGDDLDDKKSEGDDEGDDEGDEDEGDDEGDGKSGELNMDAPIKVKIDGEEVELPLREAIQSGIREKTFYKRLNEVSAARAVAEEVYNASIDTVRIYQGKIDQIEVELSNLQGLSKEPNWIEEYKRDPEAAAAKQQAWDDFKKSRAALTKERDAAQQHLERVSGERAARNLKAEHGRMLQAVPEWNDPEKFARARAAIARTAKAVGFVDDEINGVQDHRMMLILDKAARYDAIVRTRKPKSGVQSQKPGKGGAVNNRAASNSSSRAAKRLVRSGSIDEATNVFKGLI